MRVLYFLAIAAMVVFSGCNGDGNEVGDFINKKSAAGETGSFAPPLAPGNSPTATLLQQQFWVIEHYIDADLQRMSIADKGRWYQFFADGTFVNGSWEEQTGKGSWFLTVQEGKEFLLLDNIDNTQDTQFEIQAINNARDAMSWVGIKGFADGGAIIKVMQLLSRPTKAQFNVKE